MNDWMQRVAKLAMVRAPGLTAEEANALADDLYNLWPDLAPADAVAKFFSFMPKGWNGKRGGDTSQRRCA